MVNGVFILQHSYELDGIEHTKLIGAYSSQPEVDLAIERLRKQPGFCDHPDDFFSELYEFNQDHWAEGFATVTTIRVKDINGEWKAVSANVLTDGNYMIVEKYENHLLGEFKDGDIVKCDNELRAVEKLKNNTESL